MSKIQLEVAKMPIHFDCYVLFGYLSLMSELISDCQDSPLLIFWGRLLLRNSLFNILRLSSIRGYLQFWLGPLILSIKFEGDPINGCSDIPLLRFWGLLRLKNVFILSNFQFRFGHLKTYFWNFSQTRPVVVEIFHF